MEKIKERVMILSVLEQFFAHQSIIILQQKINGQLQQIEARLDHIGEKQQALFLRPIGSGGINFDHRLHIECMNYKNNLEFNCTFLYPGPGELLAISLPDEITVNNLRNSPRFKLSDYQIPVHLQKNQTTQCVGQLLDISKTGLGMISLDTRALGPQQGDLVEIVAINLGEGRPNCDGRIVYVHQLVSAADGLGRSFRLGIKFHRAIDVETFINSLISQRQSRNF